MIPWRYISRSLGGNELRHVQQELADNYGIGNMYDLVKEGNWTFDKMLDITKDRYQDLDGDGEVSDNDAFGMIHGTATEIDNYKRRSRFRSRSAGTTVIRSLRSRARKLSTCSRGSTPGCGTRMTCIGDLTLTVRCFRRFSAAATVCCLTLRSERRRTCGI